jgi:hypothetical protein
MNMIVTVFTIIGAVAATLPVLASIARWLYKRVKAAREEKARLVRELAGANARVEDLERQLKEVTAISLQAKRRRL